ncbi:hypothetical protein [Streptomyces sp. NPDC005953]|uniref:hypothetical protein n=1 Tax=Streptomyces sp. NPDC005953 TaxID=3156719 RepID=UPI00340EE584
MPLIRSLVPGAVPAAGAGRRGGGAAGSRQLSGGYGPRLLPATSSYQGSDQSSDQSSYEGTKREQIQQR